MPDTILYDSAMRLFGDLVTPEVLAAAEKGAWPDRLWQAVEEAGYLDVLAGGDSGMIEAATILRAAGHHATPIPLGETMLARSLCAACELATPPGALLTPSFRELQERPRDPHSAGWLPDDHQDGVVACDSAEDRRPGRVIDRRREELCPTRRSAEYHQVGAGLGGEEQFRRDPGQPRGSLPVRPGRRLRAQRPLGEAARP